MQSERNGERREVDIYQILPKTDFDRLTYLKGIWELTNALVDASRYFESVERDVTDYFLENTEKYVDQQTLSLHVIPYSHQLFPNFFTLKIVVAELFLIPRILDYHYQYYLNETPDKENSKENRIKFLDFIEFNILQFLHVRTPFNYVERGNYLVAWLREKRKKIQTKWPIIENVNEENRKRVDVEGVLSNRFVEKFDQLEELLVTKEWIKKNGKENLVWSDSKKNLAIAICIMNEKRYFVRDIFEKRNAALRRDVKQFFEIRYNISLEQYLEPSRIKFLEFKKFLGTHPFSRI